MRGVVCALLFLMSGGAALAQDYDIAGVGAYFCDQIGGEPSGDHTCLAPYRPYSGDACAIFDARRDDDPESADFAAQIMGSCDADGIDEAKATTLSMRAELRGYVSAGNDESVNDPVANPRYRPGEATFYAGSRYFAAECAVQTCGSGGGGAGSGAPGGSSAPTPDGAGTAAQACPWQRDGTCDEPVLCPTGTDTEDCRRPAACLYENDGACDAPGLCPAGTDLADCRGKGAAPPQGTLVEFCLTPGRWNTAWVAIGRREAGAETRLRFLGWWKISAGECRSVGRTVGGYIYFYAHTEKRDFGRRWWSGDHEACVATRKFD